MITIQLLGLDQFVVGHYSKDHTANIAQLFEVDEDQILFYAPNAMIFHNGVEQTSWRTQVIVTAPKKFRPLEKAVADYLLATVPEFSIHVDIRFIYFEETSCYSKFREGYPLFITGDNIRSTEDEYSFEFGELPEDDDDDECDDPECDCHHHHHHHEESEELEEGEGDDQIFLGDAFAGFEEKLEAAKKKKKD